MKQTSFIEAEPACEISDGSMRLMVHIPADLPAGEAEAAAKRWAASAMKLRAQAFDLVGAGASVKDIMEKQAAARHCFRLARAYRKHAQEVAARAAAAAAEVQP